MPQITSAEKSEIWVGSVTPVCSVTVDKAHLRYARTPTRVRDKQDTNWWAKRHELCSRFIKDLQAGSVIDFSPSHGPWAEATVRSEEVVTYLGLVNSKTHATVIRDYLDKQVIKLFTDSNHKRFYKEDKTDKIKEHFPLLFAKPVAEDSEDEHMSAGCDSE